MISNNKINNINYGEDIVQQLIDNIDWKSLNFNSWEEAEKYIRDNFLYIFSSGIDAFSLSSIFDESTKNLSAKDYIKKIKSVVADIQKELKAKNIAVDFNLDFLTNTKQDKLDRSYNKFNLNSNSNEDIAKYINSLDESELEILLGLDVDTSTPLDKIKQMVDEASKLASKGIIVDLSPIHEEIDKIQSAYQTVAEAIHEYDTTQMLSLDTIQSLLQLDSKYLAILYDENGQLQLNTEGYNNLTRAKLLQMQVDMVGNAITTINSLNNEQAAKNYLKDTTLDLTSAKWEDVAVTLELARTDLLAAQANGEAVEARLEALNLIEADINAKKQLWEQAEESMKQNANGFYGYTPPTNTDNQGQENVFDWIANSVDNASNAVDILQDKLANASLNEKIPIFEELKDANQDLVDATEEAAKAYKDEWIEKASEISPEYRDKITSMDTFEIESFKNDESYEKLKAAKEAYDQWQESVKAHTDALKTQEQTEKDIISNNLEIKQIKLDTLSIANQDNMTALEKNKLLREERDLLKEIMKDELALAGSDEEKEKIKATTKQKLDDNTREQYENNKKERDNKISFYDSRVKDIQNDIALEEAKGGQGTESQYLEMNQNLDDEIKHYNLAYDAALDGRNGAKWGTDLWTQYNEELQEAEDNLNACEVAQIENNRAMLMLPVKQYEDANEELEKQLDLQNKHLEKLESALGYAQLLVQDEIDALNEEKELISESYEDRIKAIQEEKDALTESNDERQREIDLENKKFALAKAMSNRTTRVKYMPATTVM